MTAVQSGVLTVRRLRPWQVVGAALLLATLALTMWSVTARAAVNITAATGGEAISLDTTSDGGTGVYTTLSTITIAEVANGDFGWVGDLPRTIILDAPLGFGFEADADCSTDIGGGGGNLIVNSCATTAAAITITITVTGGHLQDTLTISNLAVRPTTRTPSTGIITNSGTQPIEGVTNGVTSFGTLTSVAGAPAQIALTGPAAVTAGVASTSFVIGVQDQFGNPTNTTQETTFTLTSTDNGSATFAPVTGVVANATQWGSFTYTQTVAGLKTVTATRATGDALAGGTSDTHNITVNAAGYSAAHSTVAVTGGASITYPGTTTVTLTARDQFSNPITTLDTGTVTFALTGDGTSIGNFGATSHQGAGVYQSTFTGSVAGTARTFAGRVGGVAATLGGDPTITVTPKAITVASGVTAQNKVYDGTTAATLSYLEPKLNGVELGDASDVGLYTPDVTATFTSEDVGSGITVTVSGLSLGGERASNYTLTQPTATADITPRALTVMGVTALNKVYDGNTTATVDASGAAFVGVLGGDTVTVGGTATGTFADANVGTGKTVTIAGITAGGADGGNYTVTQPTTTANITAAPAPSEDPEPSPSPTIANDPTGVSVAVEDEVEAVVSAGASTELTTTASDGSTATVTAPAGALPTGSTLTAAAISNLQNLVVQAPPPANAQLTLAFVIEATDAAGNAITADFAEPIQLEFNVPASSVPAGATVDEIVLAFWNGTAWTEVAATVTINADGTLTINASVDHFTIFSVQHQPDRGKFTRAPVFPVTFTVWNGGGYTLLDSAVGSGNSAWVMVDGRFYSYVVGAPAFVNATFISMFPAGIGSNTAVFVSRPVLSPGS